MTHDRALVQALARAAIAANEMGSDAQGRAILDAIEAQGWVVVPVHYNDAMMAAAISAHESNANWQDLDEVWHAMLAARPGAQP